MQNIIVARDIHKEFTQGNSVVKVLNGINLKIDTGKLYCITGASGSGKSTLLYILSALEKADSGKLFFENKLYPDIDWKQDKKLSKLRSDKFSFVFQFFNLMPVLTVEENVILPLILSKKMNKEKSIKLDEVLGKLNILQLKKQNVNKLSGGEQQRVSIARAIMSDGKVIFADEPTGNLDNKNSHIVYSHLKKIAKEYDKAIIAVTHDNEMLEYSDVIYNLKNGIIKKN